MEPARRARVRKREEAVVNVTRKTHLPDRRIKAAEEPAAEAARVADRAAVKAQAEAGERDLKIISIILQFN